MTSHHRDMTSLIDQAIDLLDAIKNSYEDNPSMLPKLDLVPKAVTDSIGKDVITVYWVGCAGLGRLAHDVLGDTIYKIGSTTEAKLEDRLDIIGRDEYGAYSYGESRDLEKEPGFQRWIAHAIHTRRGSYDPSIMVATRSINIIRPATLDRRTFDAALSRALAPWNLQRTHPSIERYTKASIGTDRITRATELYVGLDPRRDGNRLLEIVEDIMARDGNKVAPSRAPLSSVSKPIGNELRPRRPISRSSVLAARRRR